MLYPLSYEPVCDDAQPTILLHLPNGVIPNFAHARRLPILSRPKAKITFPCGFFGNPHTIVICAKI